LGSGGATVTGLRSRSAHQLVNGCGGDFDLPLARPAPGVPVATLWVLLTVHFHSDPATRAGNPGFARGSRPVAEFYTDARVVEWLIRQTLMLNRSSTLHTLLESYDYVQEKRPQGIVQRVRSAVSKDPNAKHLVKRFGRILPLGDQTLPLRVDFLGQNYACYFLQVSKSPRGHEQNTDKAFGKLYELQALRRLLQTPQDIWELLEDERPQKFELVMVADRNNMEQRQAIYKVEKLADKGEIIAKTVASANDAAEHVAHKERQAA
jgi:hypothetical protein